mmetsp:Transcript_46092/g.141947  ORF Transcript_46092/g.141947 Transcript_46092/m.141947 type:complete len:250 (+) Transcript_46092:812-1561(+)
MCGSPHTSRRTPPPSSAMRSRRTRIVARPPPNFAATSSCCRASSTRDRDPWHPRHRSPANFSQQATPYRPRVARPNQRSRARHLTTCRPASTLAGRRSRNRLRAATAPSSRRRNMWRSRCLRADLRQHTAGDRQPAAATSPARRTRLPCRRSNAPACDSGASQSTSPQPRLGFLLARAQAQRPCRFRPAVRASQRRPRRTARYPSWCLPSSRSRARVSSPPGRRPFSPSWLSLFCSAPAASCLAKTPLV